MGPEDPSGRVDLPIYRDDDADPAALVCQVGSTQLMYDPHAIEDLHAWLREQGDWVPRGSYRRANRPPTAPSRRAARRDNPVGGWYGLRKGYHGRFGMYLPPLLEPSASPSWSTTPATTGCARSDACPALTPGAE